MNPKDTRTALITGFAVLAALAAGSALTSTLPSADDVTAAPFVSTSSVGQPVTLRTGTVTVLSVDASTAITNGLDKAVSQHGTFLVVRLAWTASPKPRPLTKLEIRTPSGRSYHDGSPIISVCPTPQTGIPIRFQTAFEMPASELAGAVLVVPATAPDAPGDQQAHIDLGIDASLAADLGARTSELKLPAAQEGAR